MKSYKCNLVGDPGVGKTSLLITIEENNFPNESTRNQLSRWNYQKDVIINGKANNLLLWNSPGGDDYERLRPLGYVNNDIFLICFSLVNPLSFKNCKKKWYPEIRSHCRKKPIILVGTKLDLRENDMETLTTVSFSQGLEMAKHIGAIKYLECSAKTQKNLKLLLFEVVKSIQVKKKRKCTII